MKKKEHTWLEIIGLLAFVVIIALYLSYSLPPGEVDTFDVEEVETQESPQQQPPQTETPEPVSNESTELKQEGE